MKRTALLLLTVLLASASMVDAKTIATTDSPASVPVLLGLEPVRQDLKLSSLQCALLDSLRAEYKAKVGVVASAGLLDSKLAPKASADLDAYRASYNRRALNVLNPAQQQRLRQIERQMLGATLLTSPAEQKLLGLDDRQIRKIGEIHAYDQTKAASIMKRFHEGRINSFRKDLDLRRLQKTVGRSIYAILTPDQRKQWLGLTGPKLKL
ncbi:MAG: hypothetical protein WAL87_04110 [Chthoniobacterales bacterium]